MAFSCNNFTKSTLNPINVKVGVRNQIILGDKLTRGKGYGSAAKAGFDIVDKFETNNILQPSLVHMELN